MNLQLWYSVVFPTAALLSIIRMCTGLVLLILSCVHEVNFYRKLKVFLFYIRKSLLVSTIENNMLESRVFQTSARAFCWVLNCQNNQLNLAEIIVRVRVAGIISACDVWLWVLDKKSLKTAVPKFVSLNRYRITYLLFSHIITYIAFLFVWWALCRTYLRYQNHYPLK